MHRQAINTVLFLILVSLMITVLWFQLHGHPVILAGDNVANGIEYKDYITILLTALAVMMAMATILLAALAIWGFGALKDEAKKVAQEVAQRVAIQTAKDVAGPIAARESRNELPLGTSAQEAVDIATSIDGDDTQGKKGRKLK